MTTNTLKNKEKMQQKYNVNIATMTVEEFKKLPVAPARKSYNWDAIPDGSIQTIDSVMKLVGCNRHMAANWLNRNSSEKRTWFDKVSRRQRVAYLISKK